MKTYKKGNIQVLPVVVQMYLLFSSILLSSINIFCACYIVPVCVCTSWKSHIGKYLLIT